MTASDTERLLIGAMLARPGRHEARLSWVDPTWLRDPAMRAMLRVLRARPMGEEAAATFVGRMKPGKARDALLAALPGLPVRARDVDVDNAARDVAETARREHMLDRIRWALDVTKEGRSGKAAEVIRLLAGELPSFDPGSPAPGGVADGAEALMREYEAARESGGAYAPTGVARLDELCGGGKPCEMWMIGGSTSAGKTCLALNIAYGAWLAGRSVFWAPIEMPRKDVVVLFVVRHAMTLFPDEPVDLMSYRLGRLTAREKEIVAAAAVDIRKREGRAPRFRIWDMPRRSTFQTVADQVESMRHTAEIDLLVVDYLAQLYPIQRGKDQRQNLDETIAEAKWFAKTYNNGRGLWLLTPHQISREGQASALKRKPHPHYWTNDLKESGRAECESDVVLWIMRTEKLKAASQVLVGMAKNRGGPTIPLGFKMYERFSSSYLGNLDDSGIVPGDGDFDDVG